MKVFGQRTAFQIQNQSFTKFVYKSKSSFAITLNALVQRSIAVHNPIMREEEMDQNRWSKKDEKQILKLNMLYSTPIHLQFSEYQSSRRNKENSKFPPHCPMPILLPRCTFLKAFSGFVVYPLFKFHDFMATA